MFIAAEGIPFVVIPIIAGAFLLLLRLGPAAVIPGVLFIVLGLFCAFFFRNPSRRIPGGENLLVSPCDGTVMEVSEKDGRKLVRVFLSVFNVHLQRAPEAGTVKSVEYRPGKCLPAMKPEAHVVNEQNVITIQTAKGEYVVTQIAGILARRVVSWVKPGDTLARGQLIGLIKFSSQVDLLLPAEARVSLKPGDAITAGETVIGEW